MAMRRGPTAGSRVGLRQGLDVGITGIPNYVGIGWLRSTASALKTVRRSTWTLASSTGRCRPHSRVMKPAAGGDLDSVVLGTQGRLEPVIDGQPAPELAAALAPVYGVPPPGCWVAGDETAVPVDRLFPPRETNGT